MRRARIKVDPESGDAFYHLISRTVNGEWLLGTTGKEILRRQIWQVAQYAGIEVITGQARGQADICIFSRCLILPRVATARGI